MNFVCFGAIINTNEFEVLLNDLELNPLHRWIHRNESDKMPIGPMDYIVQCKELNYKRWEVKNLDVIEHSYVLHEGTLYPSKQHKKFKGMNNNRIISIDKKKVQETYSGEQKFRIGKEMYPEKYQFYFHWPVRFFRYFADRKDLNLHQPLSGISNREIFELLNIEDSITIVGMFNKTLHIYANSRIKLEQGLPSPGKWTQIKIDCNNWFDDHNNPNYDEISDFFTYKPSNEKKSKKKTRPANPEIQKKKEELRRAYYKLTSVDGFNHKKAIDILEKDYPDWKRSTIITYIKR